MIGTDGEMFHFNGIDHSIELVHWHPSTLHVTITHGKHNSVVGRGVLHMKPINMGSKLARLSGTVHMIARAAGEYIKYGAKQTTRVFFARSTSETHPQSHPLAEDGH
jgi:hypothetical protein